MVARDTLHLNGLLLLCIRNLQDTSHMVPVLRAFMASLRDICLAMDAEGNGPGLCVCPSVSACMYLCVWLCSICGDGWKGKGAGL